MDTTRPLYRQEIQSFLLWMPNWIGDVVLTLPVIQSLRRAYPVARISVVVKSPSDELLLGHPAINTVFNIAFRIGKRILAKGQAFPEPEKILL